MGRAALRIRLLGGFEVEGIESASLGSRKGRTLLKRLSVAAGSPVSVDALVDTIWPDDTAPSHPADQLSVLVSRLRRQLGPEAITYADGSYVLAVDWLDVDELRRRTEEAARRLGDGSAALARAAATAALALVRGPLLAEDLDEPWTKDLRAAARRVVAHARHLAAEAALASGLQWEATDHAATALTEDPYDEAALRLLMTAHVAAGRPALALAAYAETAELVASELGVDLDPQTQALHLAVLRGDGEPATPVPTAARRTLAGRDRELSALRRSLERAASGTAAVVVVEGEAGIGKSTLLAAFAEQAAGDAEVLRASAETVGVLPMEPILDMLGRALTTMADDEAAAILGPESELIGTLLRPGTAATSSAYRDLLVAYEPGEQSAPAVLHLALLAVLARLCQRRPVVLLLDDAHLSDRATLSWLGLLARRGAGMRLLAIAARRPVGPSIAASETVELGRLDDEAASAIVALHVEPAQLDAIVRRSAGLPLFLVELAQATGGTLPDTIRESVVARLADAEGASSTLHAAAVLGNEIDVDLLATVLDLPTSRLLDDLEDGARRRILDDSSAGYVFHHDLIPEALDVDTSSPRRAWLHREAAQALARRVPAEQLRVAHHARLGGNPGLAAQALCLAAEQAGARFDHEAALALAVESLELADSAQAHLIRGRSHVLLRQYAEARLAADRARALGSEPALEVAAFAAYYARDLDAVLRLADESALTASNPEVLDTCQYLAAKVLHTRGQITEAEQRLSQMATAPARSSMAAFSRTWRTFIHLHRGHLAAATADLTGSDNARRTPIPYAPLYVDQFAAHLAALDGRPIEALAIAERMRETAAEQNALRFVGRAEVYRGWALTLLCDPSAADALEEARNVARTAGNPEPLGQGSLDLATLHLDSGRVEEAVALLDEVDEVLAAGGQVSNSWRISLRATYLRGRVAASVGDAAAASELAAAVIARAGEDSMDRYDVLGSLLAIESDAVGGAAVEIERVIALLPDLLAAARPEAWRLAARLAHRLGSAELLAWSGERVDELVAAAGPYGDQIRKTAATVLSPGP